jgi:hypothetical protein
MLRYALVLMVVLAAARLVYEFWRLLLDSCPPGAIDLHILYNLTEDWFSGKPFPSMYPPAAYPIFWLFYGWLPISAARWLWALTSIAILVGLALFLIRAIGLKIRFERLFCVVFLLAIYPTAITIGNGQMTLHVMFPLLIGVFLVKEKERHWKWDLLVFLLLLFALVKPTITLPFLWIVLFAASSIRVFSMLSVGYVALTLFSMSFREYGLVRIIQDLKIHSSGIFSYRGYANLYAWLGDLNLQSWAFPAALLVFLGLGIWCYRHRQTDLWLQLGVVAIVARFWIYHRLYDDLLIILPMMALLQVAREGASPDNRDIKAGILIFLSWGALLIPGTLYRLPSPIGLPFRICQIVIWILMLIFLVLQAEKLRKMNLNR